MKLIALLIVAFLPPLILAVNFLYLVLTRSTYEQIFQKLSIYQNFSSQDEAIYLIDNLIGYFRGKNMLEQNFFSTQAVLHLADVKQIFKTIKIINLFSLAVVSFSMILLIFTKKCSLIAKSLLLGSTLTIILTILISALFLFNFSDSFEKLHLFFFNNDLWLFDITDSLFKLFPPTFFMAFAGILTADIIVTSTVIFYLAKSMAHEK